MFCASPPPIPHILKWRQRPSGPSKLFPRLILSHGSETVPEHQRHSLTSLITYSMEQSPSWETNWFSVSQEIPRILQNPNVYYRIHRCPPPVPILSQLDPVHPPTFHFLKIHLNIIFPATAGCTKYTRWSVLPSGPLPSCFPTIILCTPLLSPIHPTCPTVQRKSRCDNNNNFSPLALQPIVVLYFATL
jgi:hypothetical protein